MADYGINSQSTGLSISQAEQILDLVFDQGVKSIPGTAAVAAAMGGQTFKPATDDDAGIRAAMLAASNAGGGVVPLKALTYTILSALPIYPGVSVVGVAPTLSWNTADSPDGASTTLAGGTILRGDGTFDCFAVNTATLGAPPTSISNSGKSAVGFQNIGFDNFSTAIHAGGTNNPGLWYTVLKNIYITNCTSWAINLENWQHVLAEYIFSYATTHGQRYSCSLDAAKLSPGNSNFNHIYHILPNNAPITARGIVFESYGTNAQLNEVDVGYIQCNGPSRAVLAPVATSGTANGSPNITVPDGTKFSVGLPVFPDATANGLKLNQTYFVASVNGNVITISDTYGGAAKNLTGSTAFNIGSYGYPGVELNGWGGGTFLHFTIGHCDLETVSTTGFFVQNVTSGRIGLRNIPATGANKGCSHLCSRISTFLIDQSYEGLIIDSDTSGSMFASGKLGASIQNNRVPYGVYKDEQITGSRPGLALTEYQKHDIYAQDTGAGDSLYVRIPFQFRVQQRGAGETESYSNGGYSTYNGAGGGSRTLPNITSDVMVGETFCVSNPSSGTLTWNTSNSQTFNNKAAATALTLAANSVATVQAQKIGGTYFWAILGGSGTLTF